MQSKIKLLLASCLLSLMVSGCATQANKDPLEGLNRGVYKFNDVADKALIKPVATAYKTVTPSPVRKGFNNFFSNLGSITTVLNDLLQFKFASAFTDAGRFVINSTFGLAGFIDVAGMDKIPNHKEDFGQTLGYWGVGNGPYLVLPFLGPSTVRDTSGLVFDTFTSDPIQYPHNIGQVPLTNQLRAAQIIDKRTELLDAGELVDSASLDPYSFLRDAYLQRRVNLIADGAASTKPADDGFEPADEDKVDAMPAATGPAEAVTPAEMPAATPDEVMEKMEEMPAEAK
jgi:phospholipid-binding lipoprotein MlaA